MELRSLEHLDENNEVVELVIGDEVVAQAIVTADDGEYIISMMHVHRTDLSDCILNEYIGNPPS